MDHASLDAWGADIGQRLTAAQREHGRFMLLDFATLIHEQFPDAKRIGMYRDEGMFFTSFVWDEEDNDLRDHDPNFDDGGGYHLTETEEEEWSPFYIEFTPQPFGDVDIMIDVQKVLSEITPPKEET